MDVCVYITFERGNFRYSVDELWWSYLWRTKFANWNVSYDVKMFCNSVTKIENKIMTLTRSCVGRQLLTLKLKLISDQYMMQLLLISKRYIAMDPMVIATSLSMNQKVHRQTTRHTSINYRIKMVKNYYLLVSSIQRQSINRPVSRGAGGA